LLTVSWPTNAINHGGRDMGVSNDGNDQKRFNCLSQYSFYETMIEELHC